MAHMLCTYYKELRAPTFFITNEVYKRNSFFSVKLNNRKGLLKVRRMDYQQRRKTIGFYHAFQLLITEKLITDIGPHTEEKIDCCL